MKSETIRNKTDVTLSYNDNNNQYNDLNVSAKSISGKHIKLVELTSLYRVFVLSNNYSFATHYLNVITSSNGSGVISKEQVLKANRIVKALALKMGAEGYDINNPSELLIVNNRKEKHIYVYNLKAMVYLISKAMLEENKYTSVIKGLSDNFTIQQSFDSSSSDNRIGKLVHKLNDIKITGVLSGAQLDAYKSVLEKQS